MGPGPAGDGDGFGANLMFCFGRWRARLVSTPVNLEMPLVSQMGLSEQRWRCRENYVERSVVSLVRTSVSEVPAMAPGLRWNAVGGGRLESRLAAG